MPAKITTYTSLDDALKAMPTKREIRESIQGPGYHLPIPYNKRGGIKERDILKAVKDICQYHFQWFVRLDVAGKIVWGAAGGTLCPSQMVGMPDLIAMHHGEFFAIECKAPGGIVSAAQHHVLTEIVRAGGRALIVVDPSRLARNDKLRNWEGFELY